MSVIEIFILLLPSIALTIIFCVKWWRMANRVKQLTAELEAMHKETTEMVSLLQKINRSLSDGKLPE
jgi:hypothetical protein